jgi:MFS family permease
VVLYRSMESKALFASGVTGMEDNAYGGSASNNINEHKPLAPASLGELHTYLTNGRYFTTRTIFVRNLFARSAVFYPFLLEGIFMGVWSSYLPNIEDSLHLSDSQLGVAVLCVYLATVMVTPLAAYTIRHLGAKLATLIGAVTFAISLPFIAFANAYGLLVVAMFAFGGTMGLMDVSMNACAILTEIVAAKPLMGSFHGSYSVAAAIGSLLGGAFVSAHYSTTHVFLVLSGLATAMAIASSFNMYTHAQEKIINAFNDEQDRLDLAEQIVKERQHSRAASRSAERDPENNALLSVNSPLVNDKFHDGIPGGDNAQEDTSGAVAASGKQSIIFFCAVGFLAAFGESGIVTWSTVFFERYLPTTSVTRSLGFTCFMVCMAVGRFCCDYLRRLFGRRLIVKVGGLLACSGVLLVSLSVSLPGSLVFGCLGFACAGLGLSTLIPIMFSSAGHIPGLPADATIATVAGFSYSGSIVSSPLIGFLSSDVFHSLRFAMLAYGCILGLIFVFGHGIPLEFGVLASNHRDHSRDADDDDRANTGNSRDS